MRFLDAAIYARCQNEAASREKCNRDYVPLKDFDRRRPDRSSGRN
jgi:hypothetical protein